ncbi:MAG: DNA polymerase III subunit alpha [Patescibacteria group bacterium]
MLDFVHLHVHSHYSLLDGLAKIDDLVAKAKELGMPALALTDHGVMYGAVEFFQKATKAGIKPIIGVEAYVARNGMLNKRARIDERPFHLVLLARNIDGYRNLIKLTSQAHLQGFYYKPRIDLELLRKHADGIIGLSACLQGAVAQSLLNHDAKHAEQTALELSAIFGPENFYLEIQDHPGLEHQADINKKILALGKKLNLPVVATNDVHYLNTEDDQTHDILICLQTKRKKEDKDRMSYLGEDFSLKSPDRMAEAFMDHPEVLANTLKVAERCSVELELGKITLPHFDVPDGKMADEYLRELCYLGLPKRFPEHAKDKKIIERLEYELTVITKTGFAPYFLIVQDFVNWAKNNKIVVGPGRGSAAGSIVSYLTNITNVDPLKYELIFERFLNPERVSMPDIDLDFADTRRNEVLEYVEQKYGKNHVAQIITFGTMAARAAIRDAGRVLNLAYTYCDKLAKMIPMSLTINQALGLNPELKEEYEHSPEATTLINAARKLEGVARHASTHACGVVITKEPLDNYVPVQYATQGENIIISQYSLHPIEDLGLLKMDFLGLKNLTILENTIDIIRKARHVETNTDDLDLDDKKTFKLLQDGLTTGVFQLESSGMKRYLKQLKPTELEDIIAMVALYRPGPMEFIPDFIAGKHGRKQTVYLHPKLQPILEKTHGVAVYQEQLMQIARNLAGFTMPEADILRKAVGKKIKKLLDEQHEKLVDGMVKNKITKSVAEKIWKIVEPFARYGFVRAHAACYALIAYQTAFFKANYPDEFMASLLTSDYGDIDRIAIEVEECERMGIRVLPPDINESYSTFTAVFNPETRQPEKKIRFGLMAIKNVGANIVRTIIKERKANGPYHSLEDFLRRVQTKDLNKKSLESLTKSGAMDQFSERQVLLDNMDSLLQYAKAAEKEALNGQTNIFSTSPVQHAPRLKLRPTAPAGKSQKLAWEKELLGLYISEHPLEEYRHYLSQIASPISDLTTPVMMHGDVKIGGIITQIQKVITRSNQAMVFAKIEDMSGRIEVLVFPKLFSSQPLLWQEGRIVLAKGKLSDKDGVVKLLCNEAREIDLANGTKNPTADTGSIYLSIPQKVGQSTFAKLKSILSQSSGPYQVHLKISSPDTTKIISTKFHIGEDSFTQIESLIGRGNLAVQKK